MANELRVAAAALLTQNLVRHNESESKLEPRTKPRHYLFPNRQVQVSLVANDHVYKPQRQQHPSSPEMSGGGVSMKTATADTPRPPPAAASASRLPPRGNRAHGGGEGVSG
jgi:hypothetical protein